jgi:hypothetical protein
MTNSSAGEGERDLSSKGADSNNEGVQVRESAQLRDSPLALLVGHDLSMEEVTLSLPGDAIYGNEQETIALLPDTGALLGKDKSAELLGRRLGDAAVSAQLGRDLSRQKVREVFAHPTNHLLSSGSSRGRRVEPTPGNGQQIPGRHQVENRAPTLSRARFLDQEDVWSSRRLSHEELSLVTERQ